MNEISLGEGAILILKNGVKKGSDNKKYITCFSFSRFNLFYFLRKQSSPILNLRLIPFYQYLRSYLLLCIFIFLQRLFNTSYNYFDILIIKFILKHVRNFLLVKRLKLKNFLLLCFFEISFLHFTFESWQNITKILHG